jgi:putative ABC transport system permease protein
MRRNFGFTLIAVATLALGIGANTAVFSIINTTIIRPLPFVDHERLVLTFESSAEFEWMSVSYPNFLDWREQNSVFESMTAHRLQSFNLTGTDRPERVLANQVSAALFPMLRVEPFIGRPFVEEEDKPGAEPVAVLSYGLWQRRFGGDHNIVGQSIFLDRQSFTVVGVTPQDFLYPLDQPGIDLYLPIGYFSEEWRRDNHNSIQVYARLRPGVSFEQARTDMTTIAQRLEQQYPDTNTGQSVSMGLLQDLRGRGFRPALTVFLAAVGLVLLIACANVANLLLAKASGRSHEIALRATLGAGRSRVLRQLLTESVLLSLLGGAAGLLLAVWGVNLLGLSLPETTPPVFRQFEIDGLVLGFTLMLSILTGIAFGILPALQVSKPDLVTPLKDGGRSASSGPRRHQLQDVLVTAEMSLALVLLIAAALLTVSFFRIMNESPGFNPENVLTMQISLPDTRYPEIEQTAAFFRSLDERIGAISGVRYIGMSNPLFGGWQDYFIVEGEAASLPGEENWTEVAIINPDYFRAMEIALLSGRYFSDQDRADTRNVAIIDRAFAERYFPGEDPIGKRIKRDSDPASDFPWLEIVGVVESVRRYEEFFNINSRVQLYQPFSQNLNRFVNMFVKTELPPETAVAAIRSEILEMDPYQPVFNARTLEEYLSERLYTRRISFIMLGTFAVAAVLLAAVGIYGLIAYSVSQRTHEIGVRIALGARAGDVLDLVLWKALRLTGIGIGLGLLLAVGLTPLMRNLLFGVSAREPWIFVGLALFTGVMAFAATILPALRATRITPVEALRYE